MKCTDAVKVVVVDRLARLMFSEEPELSPACELVDDGIIRCSMGPRATAVFVRCADITPAISSRVGE
jgi:hypothetical protein